MTFVRCEFLNNERISAGGGGGTSAQRLAFLLSDPDDPGLIHGIAKIYLRKFGFCQRNQMHLWLEDILVSVPHL